MCRSDRQASIVHCILLYLSCLIAVVGNFQTLLLAQDKPQGPRFAEDIAKIKERFAKSSIPNPILFVGSSTIRLWDLTKSFPGQPCINHGFGGSVLNDVDRKSVV